jgi:hypothetical protein
LDEEKPDERFREVPVLEEVTTVKEKVIELCSLPLDMFLKISPVKERNFFDLSIRTW